MLPSNGYGTVDSATIGNGNNESYSNSNETQSLLGHRVWKTSWSRKMMVNVNRDWADIVLLLCYIITGLLDSASIATWGSFVSMQTGMFKLHKARRSLLTKLTSAYRQHSLHRDRVICTTRIETLDQIWRLVNIFLYRLLLLQPLSSLLYTQPTMGSLRFILVPDDINHERRINSNLGPQV